MKLSVVVLLACPLLSVFAHPVARDDHDDAVPAALPGQWYQDQAHPVHNLFKRAPTDGVDYPAVGTPQWAAQFPPFGLINLATNPVPQAWVDAYRAAVAAGKIPAIPQSHGPLDENPTYDAGLNPVSPEICSATYKCRMPDDHWDAPAGVFASSFDDGPLPPTTRLVQFLDQHNLKTTHFMIGSHILLNPTIFLQAYNSGNDLAVHTWSHHHLTSQTDLEVVSELGWTMQIIHHSTGGRVPKYYRPPYGDTDNRVRAIALEVFGLETVIWNYDTRDYGNTLQTIQQEMTGWITGPKSPGLMILQHETSDQSVEGFISSFNAIMANNWKFESLTAVLNDGASYQNVRVGTNDVIPAQIYNASVEETTSSTSSSSSSSSSTSTSSSASTAASPSSDSPKTAESTKNSAVSLFPSLSLSGCIVIAAVALLLNP